MLKLTQIDFEKLYQGGHHDFSNMNFEDIYPKNFESEEERKQRIQAVYTEIQKMLYNERKNMRAKEKKEHV